MEKKNENIEVKDIIASPETEEVEVTACEVETKETTPCESVATTEEVSDKANPEDEYDYGDEEEETGATYKEMSPTRLVMRRFFRSKLSIVGIVMIVFLFLFSFLGPVIYDRWGETEIDETLVSKEIKSTYTYVDANGEEVEVVEVLTHVGNNIYAPPSTDHFLGTDEKGMDVFVRLMYGGRISLAIGFIVVILETIIGIILGGISGYFGGKVDQVIMRIVDIFNCIPTLPILLIASALLDSWNIQDSAVKIYLLMVIITIFGWSGTARMVRGQILSLREQEYITATEVMGLPTHRKIFVHLISNVMPQLIVSMTLGLGSVILYESTLSYLGLGVQFPKAAWGSMISMAKDPEILKYYMNLWLPAGMLIVVAVLGFNFIGDGLRDAMDPKAKK